jgi:hypothetical protein
VGLVSSRTINPEVKETKVADKTADKDITVENAQGQTVVVLAAGQPIPDNLDELKEVYSQGRISTASEDEIDAARGIVQDKSKRSSRD